MSTLTHFLTLLNTQPHTISFQQTMAIIKQYYHYTPTAFTNGRLTNAAGANEGSCQLLAFAQAQTLACFGDYYRVDVLQNPQNTDHANIRNFMQTGWAAVHFDGEALHRR
ncbi:HopJ type III effector protein [Marinagarivorans algicola]|uniref:HopJ type III effector protein n=1 Tax=Marinagarivorans algicola TaxID=1513270 RepID=UPI0006B46F2D|nr:HopJ type III effector protein [Marinagarivorans algicola]